MEELLHFLQFLNRISLKEHLIFYWRINLIWYYVCLCECHIPQFEVIRCLQVTCERLMSVVSGHSWSQSKYRLCFVETADCETDGDLSSSCLQDPLEAGSFNSPGTPPMAYAGTPAVNGHPIPALRFPSVSSILFCKLKLRLQGGAITYQGLFQQNFN